MITLPSGFSWRELWEARNHNVTESKWPTSVSNGLALTTSGTTVSIADGVHFVGQSATSNINCGAIHNGATKLVVALRFKLDTDFAAGASNHLHLWGKVGDGNNSIQVRLSRVSGKLYFYKLFGGVQVMGVTSTEASWTAGVWYHILCSISDVNAFRMRVNGGTVVTHADMSAAPAAGNFIIGDYADPGPGADGSFAGIIADVFVSESDLTPTQELELYYGFYTNAAPVNLWKLTEGRGVTAYDRGTGGNNGTLDTTSTWNFSMNKQPRVSFDGVNDYAVSAAAADIGGDLTLVYVGKLNSIYGDGVVQPASILCYSRVNDNNHIGIRGDSTTHVMQAFGSINSSPVAVAIPQNSVYISTVMLVSVKAGTDVKVWKDGVYIGVDSETNRLPVGGATVSIGRNVGASQYDTSSVLLCGILNGTVTSKTAPLVTKLLNKYLNLGLSI